MVFQKPGELVLIIQTREEMAACGTGQLRAEAVIKPLVVSVVEALLL